MDTAVSKLPRFNFGTRSSLDAKDSYLRSRGRLLVPEKRVHKQHDNWRNLFPVIDFRYQVYSPRGTPRDTENATTNPMSELQEDGPDLPKVVVDNYNTLARSTSQTARPTASDQNENFLLSFRRPLYNEIHRRFVMEGKYPADEYTGVKKHEFRQELNLKDEGREDFNTFYERDPFNLKFHRHRLRQIHGISFEPPSRDLIKGRQMWKPKTPTKPWDSELVLSKEPWPAKITDFTRHRPKRTAHSAYMSRVEKTLEANIKTHRAEIAKHQRRRRKHNEHRAPH